MKRSFVLLLSLACTACISVQKSPSAVPTDSSSSSLAYKEVFFGGEIPVTWSYASVGDAGPAPLPLPEQTWIDNESIQFSFGQDDVAYGDLNWSQVDFVSMTSDDLQMLVQRWKQHPSIREFAESWSQMLIDGRTADVLRFKTEPDGTVSKGGTGGETYFVKIDDDRGLIIQKQALGNEEFERGVQHFLETVDFDR